MSADGRSVLRGGYGIFYDNSVSEEAELERTDRLKAELRTGGGVAQGGIRMLIRGTRR
jgi:hypothetical protein